MVERWHDHKKSPAPSAAATAAAAVKAKIEKTKSSFWGILGKIRTVILLIITFFIVYGAARWGLREKCPPGQVREQWFGLFGDCVVSSSTIRQMMKAVQKSTVHEICNTPWRTSGEKDGKAVIGGSMSSITERLDDPPSFGVAEIWKHVQTESFPWEKLEDRGISRNWSGEASDIRVWLKGRPEVLRALWSCWAFRCRLRIWVAEQYPSIAIALVCLVVAMCVYWKSRSKAKEKAQVEAIKREVIELLILEGEMPPEHARDDIVYRLDKDYAYLGLSARRIKKLWNHVVEAVEKESRVAKSNIERFGRVNKLGQKSDTAQQ